MWGRVGWWAHRFQGRRERRGHGSEAQRCRLDLTPEPRLCAMHVPCGLLSTTAGACRGGTRLRGLTEEPLAPQGVLPSARGSS